MIVGVNLMYLVPGVVGGTEDYAVRVLGAAAAHPDTELTYCVFARPSVFAAHPSLASAFARDTIDVPRNRVLRVALESTWLARSLRNRGADLVHHLGGRVPAAGRTPSVVTIHDLQPLDRPDHFSAAKQRYLAYALPRSAARARVVVTVSEWVKDSVVQRLRVDPARVHVVSAPVLDPRPSAVDALPAALRRLIDDGEPFVVYPAITHPHKDHATLVAAFARAAERGAPGRLVLPGGDGASAPQVDAQLAAIDPAIASRVLRPGRLDRGQIDILLAHASALAFPSTYEGFGLPVVEALVSGCPVIVSDIPVLREVVDGVDEVSTVDGVDEVSTAVVTRVGVGDVASWADAVGAALAGRGGARDPATRGRVVDASRAVRERLSPRAVAARWHAVHRLAADSGGE